MAVERSVEPHIRGILKSDVLPGERIIRWFDPCETLAPFVQRFWWADWTIAPGECREQLILPYPCANIVVAAGTATITGVVTRAAVQQLGGTGSAFGAKLQPAAFRSLGINQPTTLRDKTVPAAAVLKGDEPYWPSADPESCVQALETYLLSQCEEQDRVSRKAGEIVHAVEADRDIVSVSQLAKIHSLSVRSIQDICNRAIGVSPKWLIRCFRLQDALERLETGTSVNLSALAQDLGYFDQAHFTRDFVGITGSTPGRY